MKSYKKAAAFCDEALKFNNNSLHGLLYKAHIHMEAQNFDAAIGILSKAKELHPGDQRIPQLLQRAQTELRRSKTKDYYKVLGLTRDADEVQIKGAYRKMVKLHHPDKAHKLGITKEDAERKMAQVNEAYEVLSDPELKVRYDQGDDPNDHEQQRHQPFQGSEFQRYGNGGGKPFGGHSGGQQFSFKFGGQGFTFG
jgi:DnaJ family protein C protein 3